MRKCLLALVVFALVGIANAEAQPTVYVSNLTGHQIFAVDGTSGTTLIEFTGDSTFTPEDMVIGPDGKLYVCDVGPTPALWRFDVGPTVSNPNPATLSNPVKIVDFTVAPQSGVIPAGPTFSGSDDLYFNSRGSGVWLVAGVATPNTGPTYSAAPVFTSAQTGTFGTGTTVEAFGHLLIVDQSRNRVLSANATIGSFGAAGNFFTAPAPLITGLKAPVGLTTNTCSDALVASGTGIQRFSLTKDLSSGNLTATSQGTYVDFGKTNAVQYVERDASNNLWVATNSSSGGGIVWKVSPVGDPVSSCSAATITQLVSFKKLSQGTNATLTSSQIQAVGVAIPATNYTTPAASFDQGHPSATFSFGQYTLTLTYSQVLKPFSQKFTALMSQPSQVTFSSSAFQTSTVGMRFPSLGGFIIQFLTKSQSAMPPGCTSYGVPNATCDVPVSGIDYVGDATGVAFKLDLAFHDPIRGFNHPGLAHSSDDTITGVYSDDVTSDFWVLLDQTTRGHGTTWGSKYVPFDQAFQIASTFVLPLHVQVNQPALSGNPLFNLGQNFSVSIVVTDNHGVPVPGLVLRISAARIVPQPFSLEVVQATNNSTQGNFLNDNGNGKYSIGIDTSLFKGGPGTYQFTIFGQGFPPVLNLPLSNIPLPFNAVFQK